MKISKIVEKDIKKCAKVFIEAFNDKPWNDKWTLESAYKRLYDIYRCPNFIGIKYVENNEIYGALFGNCEEWFEGKQFNIKEIFVSKRIQGKSIGSKLIDNLQYEVEKVGVNYLFLSTQNNDLKNFYLKINFKEDNSLCIMSKKI